MYISQQQDHAGTPARSSTPTDKPQRKPVGQWWLTGSVERLGVVGWQIEVVAVM